MRVIVWEKYSKIRRGVGGDDLGGERARARQDGRTAEVGPGGGRARKLKVVWENDKDVWPDNRNIVIFVIAKR